MDTSSIKIAICIVSYRDKRIVDTINEAYEKAYNKNNIRFLVCIQDSYNYKVKKTENDIISYAPWDCFEGFNRLRNNLISNALSEEFIFFVSSATSFIDNWDLYLLNKIVDDNYIYSINDKFSLDGTLIKKSIIDKIGYPDYLRMLGEEEEMSIRLYCNGYHILKIENCIDVLEKKEYDYIPFSKTHNYDKVYNLYKNGKNIFIDLTNSKFKFFDYDLIHPIKKIFHQLNDVEYLTHEIGALKDERFYEHGSRI